MPAILKAWFDQVFAYQFAYGSKGNKLKNKKLLPSLTIGQPEKNFKQDNSQFLIDSFLKSIKKSAEYSQMKYIEPVILYDIATVSGHTEHEIKEKAKAHSEKLKRVIQSNINENH